MQKFWNLNYGFDTDSPKQIKNMLFKFTFLVSILLGLKVYLESDRRLQKYSKSPTNSFLVILIF